ADVAVNAVAGTNREASEANGETEGIFVLVFAATRNSRGCCGDRTGSRGDCEACSRGDDNRRVSFLVNSRSSQVNAAKLVDVVKTYGPAAIEAAVISRSLVLGLASGTGFGVSVRNIRSTELEADEARREVGDLVGVGEHVRAGGDNLARRIDVRGISIEHRGRVRAGVVHQVCSTVFRTDQDTTEGAVNIDVGFVDLVSSRIGFELDVDTELDAVVERGFAMEEDFAFMRYTVGCTARRSCRVVGILIEVGALEVAAYAELDFFRRGSRCCSKCTYGDEGCCTQDCFFH